MGFSVTIYIKQDKKHSSDNTYIVSMGLKNDDDDTIEKLFVEELNNINNDSSLHYYRKGKKLPVRVRVHSPPSNKEISRLNESAFCEDLI